MNLLGWQTQRDTPAVWSMLRAAPPGVLKLLDGNRNPGLAAEWRRLVGPGGVLVYRHVYDPGFDPGDGPTRTQQVLDETEALKPWGPVLVEEPWNEEAQNGTVLCEHAEAAVLYAREARRRGFVPVVLVTSEGNPADERDWLQPRVLAALRELKRLGAVRGPHGYTTRALGPHDPDHLLRYRREDALLPADCRLSLLIGETGDDYGINGGPGHCGFRCGAAGDPVRSYGLRLAAIRDELAGDPQVIGAAVFGCGMNDDWRTFDITDEVDLRPVFAGAARPPGPIPQPEAPVTLKAIDISNWQAPPKVATPPDWAAFREQSDADLVFCKAAEDQWGVDPTLADFAREVRASSGKTLGVYHFARLSVSPAESVTLFQQAVDSIGGLRTGEHVALDIEDDTFTGSAHQWVAEWLDLAARVFGGRPWKYSGKWYTSTRDLEHDDLAAYPSWWAEYDGEANTLPAGWAPLKLWQWGQSDVPGFAGPVDQNIFYGKRADLDALGLPADYRPSQPAPPPTPEPPPPPPPPPTPDADLAARVAALEARFEKLRAALAVS